MPPTLGAAIRLSLLAFRREAWLSALGLLAAGLRRILGWPAVLVAAALLLRGASAAMRHSPGDLSAPFEGVVAVLSSPRFAGLVGGLWLAGVAASGAVRVAWLAGALPVLGAAMAGQPRGTAGFAGGVAGGFLRVMAAAVLGFALELSGALFAGTLALGAVLAVARWAGHGAGNALPLAGITALALTLALAVPAALSVAADAVVARAAVRGEGPGAALAGATRRFLQRPGTFLLGSMLFGLLLLLGRLAVGAFGGLATGFARGAPALLLLGPELMLAVLAALLVAVLELLWLGTVTALTCAEGRR